MKKIKCLSFEIPVDKISDYYRFFMVDVNIALRFDARQQGCRFGCGLVCRKQKNKYYNEVEMIEPKISDEDIAIAIFTV